MAKEEAVKQAYENLKDTLEIVNDIELGKEEEKKEEVAAEEKTEVAEKEEPAVDKKEEAEEAKTEEPKEEEKVADKEEPAKIDIPIIPEVPKAPVEEPAIKFPQFPETPHASINDEPAASFGSTIGVVPEPALDTNFKSEAEIDAFYGSLVDSANKRHEEELKLLEEAKEATRKVYISKKRLEDWRENMFAIPGEEPIGTTATFTQSEDPLKKIA